jgi:hypothetical protein
MLQDVTTISRQYLKMNITRHIGLENCACCSIAISDRSDMMLCNRVRQPLSANLTNKPQRKTYARIPYAFLGMVGRAISDSEQCTTSTEVKGYWTWDDVFQSWTLYVLGVGSPLLEGPVTCEELLEPETNATASGASEGLSTGSPTVVGESTPTGDAESSPTAAAQPAGLASPDTPEGLVSGHASEAQSGAKSSSTRGSKSDPNAAAEPFGSASSNEGMIPASLASQSGAKSSPTRGTQSRPKMAAKPTGLADSDKAMANPLQRSSTAGIAPKPSGRRRKWPHILKPLGPY